MVHTTKQCVLRVWKNVATTKLTKLATNTHHTLNYLMVGNPTSRRIGEKGLTDSCSITSYVLYPRIFCTNYIHLAFWTLLIELHVITQWWHPFLFSYTIKILEIIVLLTCFIILDVIPWQWMCTATNEMYEYVTNVQAESWGKIPLTKNFDQPDRRCDHYADE